MSFCWPGSLVSPYYTLLLLLTNFYFWQKNFCYYSDVSTRNLEAGGQINSSPVLLVCSHCKDHLFPSGKMARSLFFATSVSLNSSFLQRHLEPAKAAAERLSLPSVNPLHCLSGIWHFRDTGSPSYLDCKYENGGTQQSETHSCEMHFPKAFLQCSKASTLIESLSYCFLTVWYFPTWTCYDFHTSFSHWHDPGVRHCWRTKGNFTREDSCRAGFLLPNPVSMVRSSSLSHFCYGNTPVRSSTKEDLYCCGSCCGLCFSSTCRQANVGVPVVLGAIWLQRNVSSLGLSLLSRCTLGRRHPAGRTRGWRPDTETRLPFWVERSLLKSGGVRWLERKGQWEKWVREVDVQEGCEGEG